MSVIRASVTDQRLKITEAPVIASGGQNETSIVFTFCEKWDGLVKTAIFYRDEEEVYYCVLDAENTCVVPWEVCYESGTFYIGVFGEKDTVRRTSTTARYKVKRGALTDGLYPSNPTLDVYNQIVDMVKDVQDKLETFEETDPTVPAWAKAAKKPTYTAAEVGALSADALPGAVNNALAQAKANGEFDGAPGKDGSNGKDGVSVTHSWNGTTLTVTSASGTSSADLKGSKGDKGDPGQDAPQTSVLYTSQSLTDAQKLQARANIGAAAEGESGSVAPMIVTIRDERPSHTADVIIEHLARGGNAVLLYNDEYLALDHYYDDQNEASLVSFVKNNAEEGILTQVDIYVDGTFDEYVFVAGDLVSTNSTVHIGAEAPTDENVSLWVDTDEEASGGLTEQDVEQIVRNYAHTDDEINDLIDAKLGVIENGSY